DLLALATASELVGSTLANADAFTRQQLLVERMRSVDELKTIFLATASHELRTPVTAIVGFSGLLLSQWDSLPAEKGKVFLERVLANAKGLETLIEQLLDFSRLERGLHPAGDELLDLGERIAAILEEQTDLTGRHHLRCELAPGCLVRGSASAVERIVTNLVGNAAKYSPEGTTITVTLQTQDEWATLLVDDEGGGVAEADRERVFSRFFRGSGDTVSTTRGAGIGLAIVSEYAASMNATASVRSAPSGGARFVVSFPRVLQEQGAVDVPVA
ncbi:MAG: multi-sensor signal transduction histidine kinase, partial [Frankiales bacterium]|nr:multi-sensor signal transduction histidine kinase [Frankiales bacterium]